MRSLEVGRFACALLHVKINVLSCVHADACLIFYLESFASGPIEYSTKATSYRCMRAANQIFLSVNVHARGQRGYNQISWTGNNRAERRSDRGQITEAAERSRRKGYLIYARRSGPRCQDAGRASFLDAKVHAEIPRPLYNAEPRALERLDRHSNGHCNLCTPSLLFTLHLFFIRRSLDCHMPFRW